MRPQLPLTLAFALLLPSLAFAAPTVYAIDKNHTVVGFKIRHWVSNVEGRFNDFDGTISYDPQNPAASSVEFAVKAASIDTNHERRDTHLRSADFFDAEKFPELTFKSTKVVPKDADTLEVTGALTIHGVTKPVTVPVEILGFQDLAEGNQKAGFETSFTVNRKDYGIVWDRVLDTGGTMLGDQVKITLAIEADKQLEKKAA
jgi:polyisoprenoid-binding protein YceI